MTGTPARSRESSVSSKANGRDKDADRQGHKRTDKFKAGIGTYRFDQANDVADDKAYEDLIFPPGFPMEPQPEYNAPSSSSAADTATASQPHPTFAPRPVIRPRLDISKAGITPFDGTPSKLTSFLYDLGVFLRQQGVNVRDHPSGEECIHVVAFLDPMLAGILLYRIIVIFAGCAMFVYQGNFYHVVIVAA